MRDMAGRLVTLLLTGTCVVGMAAATEDAGAINIIISKSTDGFVAYLDWNDECVNDEVKVNFTAVYKMIGDPVSEPKGCNFTEPCFCNIPSQSLNSSHNYTLLVSVTTPKGKVLSSSKDFDPNRKALPPPDVLVRSRDALVTVMISTPDDAYKETYNLILRKNDSTEEKTIHSIERTYIIPPSDILHDQTYCVKANVCNKDTMEWSSYSPELCFTTPAKGPPNNLRMEARDLEYLLKWDWDFNQSPNATFSVEKCLTYGSCIKLKGCENITAAQCYCSGLSFSHNYILRASVYDHQREEKSSSVLQFTASQDTFIGPPKEVKMHIEDNNLYINVSAPEGFKYTPIQSFCNWLNHLEYWTNSTQGSKVVEISQPFFKIDSIEPSTTYCVKAKMRCQRSNRSSLYSDVKCVTTDPRSYLFAWIIGFAFLGIVVISGVLYICLCPLKRFIKHTFFPSCKLPSSIEKGFVESPADCNKYPFLLNEEETTHRCYIVQSSHTEDVVQINSKNTSKDSSQDSGNYSLGGQITGETDTYT